MSAAVAAPTQRHRPTPSYTTLRDVTVFDCSPLREAMTEPDGGSAHSGPVGDIPGRRLCVRSMRLFVKEELSRPSSAFTRDLMLWTSIRTRPTV